MSARAEAPDLEARLLALQRQVMILGAAANTQAPAHDDLRSAVALAAMQVCDDIDDIVATFGLDVTQAGPPRAVRARGTRGRSRATSTVIVKSPLAGTFYTCETGTVPKSVGDRVTLGQAICVIESGETASEIVSDCTGEIVAVHVEHGQPVAIGARLFTIRTGAR
jgi:biotin carboxyl carrier protein